MDAVKNNLLVELFVEELPPKALKKLGEAFAAALGDSLKAQGLASDKSVATSYASPRRLAVHLTEVAAGAADRDPGNLRRIAVQLCASGAPRRRLHGLRAPLRPRLAILSYHVFVPDLARFPPNRAAMSD